MNEFGNLWAIGYDTVERAEVTRDTIQRLRDDHFLVVPDVLVMVCNPDGTFRIDRETTPVTHSVIGFGIVGLLAGMVLLQPIVGAAVGAALGGTMAASLKRVGMSEEFIRDAQAMMKPGSAAVFVLTVPGRNDVLLHRIQGLGGKILMSNVSVELAKTVQEALENVKR